jgi:hypothetical protein
MTPPASFDATALPSDVREVFDLPSSQNLLGLRTDSGAQPL